MTVVTIETESEIRVFEIDNPLTFRDQFKEPLPFIRILTMEGEYYILTSSIKFVSIEDKIS